MSADEYVGEPVFDVEALVRQYGRDAVAAASDATYAGVPAWAMDQAAARAWLARVRERAALAAWAATPAGQEQAARVRTLGLLDAGPVCPAERLRTC